MKILQVIDLFSPLHGGGSVEAAYHLSKELAKGGHKVTIYTSDFELDQKYLDSLPQVEVYPFHTWSYTIGLTPSIVNKAKRELNHFDIIHLHNYRSFQQMVIHHYAKKYNIPYVLQAHGSLPRVIPRQSPVMRQTKRLYDVFFGYRILKDASRVIAVTQAEAKQYKNIGINKVESLPNGIDLSEFADLPQGEKFKSKYGLNNGERIILYLGRIHKIKGLDVLVKAFYKLSTEIDNARLIIAGHNDGYLPTLKGLIKELKLEDKVIFTGPLYGKDKLKAYISADVYVLPSSYEIFGITALEAIACGTPVIVSDRCGIAEIIDSQTGFVVPYNEERLSNALIDILYHDKKRQFGKHGRALVCEQFNWSKITGQLQDVYETVLKGG